MSVPIEKRLENAQKALLTAILDKGKPFDPNNPKDVKRRKELAKQAEALQSISSLVTDPTGGGLTGMARVINRAVGAKMAKSKFTQNKAKQVLDLVTKPMTRGKKAATKTTPAIKEIVETKPAIPTTIPNTMELAQIPGSTVKTIQKEVIKPFKGTKGTFTPRETERVARAREILNQPIAGSMRPSTIPQGFKSPFANTSLRKAVYVPEANPFKDFYKFKLDGDVVNKPLSNLIEGTMIAGGLGLGSALISSSNRLSDKKNNKQTTTPQKTGPVDLKRISNTRPSNIEGVSIVKGSDGKDYGIVWNNTTNSWDYYRSDKNKKTNEPTVIEKKDVREEGNRTNTRGGTGGGGTSTTPKSKTRIEFEKAFAEARKQAGGAGGIFEWNGKKYGTALVGETVPKNRVEVGKTTTPVTTPVTVKNDYPTAKTDPTLEIAMQEDSIRQQTVTKPLPTKPLSSLVFKTTSKDIRYKMDEQDALRSILENNKLPLKKKRYGGNLTMLKYMK